MICFLSFSLLHASVNFVIKRAMTILQKPDALSLSGNIKEFRIGTTDTISFVLQQGGEEVVSRSYSPGVDGIVIINIKDIVHARLSFLFKTHR